MERASVTGGRAQGYWRRNLAKMLYSASMSLDGFIAGYGGDLSWLKPFTGPNPEIEPLVNSIGSMVIGNRTFRGDDVNKDDPEKAGKAFGGGWEGKQFVLTHHPPATEVPGFTFVTDFNQAVSESKAAAGDKYVNIIGANVAKQCIEAGVLDEVFVFIVPVMLGDGVRLFDWPGGTNVRLERLHQSETPVANNLRYRVIA